LLLPLLLDWILGSESAWRSSMVMIVRMGWWFFYSWMLSCGCWMLNVERWIVNVELWINLPCALFCLSCVCFQFAFLILLLPAVQYFSYYFVEWARDDFWIGRGRGCLGEGAEGGRYDVSPLFPLLDWGGAVLLLLLFLCIQIFNPSIINPPSSIYNSNIRHKTLQAQEVTNKQTKTLLLLTNQQPNNEKLGIHGSDLGSNMWC